jgi:hypothetical protein
MYVYLTTLLSILEKDDLVFTSQPIVILTALFDLATPLPSSPTLRMECCHFTFVLISTEFTLFKWKEDRFLCFHLI